MAMTVISWNARSIKCVDKKYEVMNFLQKSECEVFAIQESFLKKEDKFYVPDYKIYRADRNTDHGGCLCTIVNKRIKSERVKLYEFKCIEVLSVILYINNSALILNNIDVPRYNAHFVDDLKALCEQNYALVI